MTGDVELPGPLAAPREPAGALGQVLIAEDDAMFRRILQKWLENWGYEVTVAGDGEEAWHILQENHSPKLLILDWMMPKLSGIDLCRLVRERPESPYQYILLVTAKDDKQDLIVGLEAGADDYISKPFDRNELRARLRTGGRILTLQAEQIAARAELLFQATHDSLTGIWNRKAICDLLQREFEISGRSGKTVGVIMLDLDNFKKVNDTYGHPAGDAVLEETTRRIGEVVRSYDLVGRYGGEEFLIVLPDCDRSQAGRCAERIRAAMASRPIFSDGIEIQMTMSLGTTLADPRANSVREALAAADCALYHAKNGGRNQVVFSALDPLGSQLTA